MNNNTPSLEQQMEQVNPHLQVTQTPSRSEVLEFNIQYNTKRIHQEWNKSEPNLDLISYLQKDVANMRHELKTIKN